MPSGRTPAPLCLKREGPSQIEPACKTKTHCFPYKRSPDRPVEKADRKSKNLFTHLLMLCIFHVAIIDNVKKSTSSARRKSLFSEANWITSWIDFLLWTRPTGNMAQTQPCDDLRHMNLLGRASFWWDFTTWGISRVDDIQSYRVAHSLCFLQRSMQLLHLQLPALLLIEIVWNNNCSQRLDGSDRRAVTWHRSQHTRSGWTLTVHQNFENVLVNTGTDGVNLKMVIDTQH